MPHIANGSPVPLMLKDNLSPLRISALLCVLLTALAQKFENQHEDFRNEDLLRRKLRKDGLMPAVLDYVPEHTPEFMFTTGVMADFGNRVNPEEIFQAPRIIRINCTHEELFTILLTDYDSPARFTGGNHEYLQWAMGNCKGENLLDGETLASFQPINPQKDTGFHRYIFYVFKQPNNEKIKFRENISNSSDTGRRNFSTKDFAAKYNLGNIYGINFFLSEWIPAEHKIPIDAELGS